MTEQLRTIEVALIVKNPLANAGDTRDMDSIPGWEDPLVGNNNPLQCSCFENPRDGGAWWAAVSGIAQSQTCQGLHF